MKHYLSYKINFGIEIDNTELVWYVLKYVNKSKKFI